jgi:alanyl aminopeptidase
LPSYLLAFAVGDFDVREGAKSPVPIRLVTTKGKSALGDFSLDATQSLVKVLGDYFAIPYPFAKLDIVAVPEFASGAMENPGLITFREEALLIDPLHPSRSAKREAASVIAHELSHMWFGDLVTMKWWNDVWLNEGFATWMGAKAVDAWRPEYGEHLTAVDARLRVMTLDGTPSARAVRQPVASTSEIEEAFDPLSYEKGAATLAMIERWLGADVVQRGVREYLKAHSWQNADEADLMGALDRASGRDVSGMAATFLDRPGVPNVAITPSCAGDELTLGLSQAAWRPLGVDARASDAAPWKIPLCVQSAAGAACTELDAASGSFVPPGATCNGWLLPNAGASGYYLASLPEASLDVLAKSCAKLDVASRMGFLSGLWSQVRAGTLDGDALLRLLPSFDRETDSHVIEVEVEVLMAMNHALVEDKARPAFRTYVAARLAQSKRRLGWKPRAGESEEDARARLKVLDALGEVARDPATLREAEALAARWLADPTKVDPDIASVAVPLASIRASLPRLSELRTAVLAAKTPDERITALRAASMFGDPATMQRAWDFALSDDVRQQDAAYVLGRSGVDLDSDSAAFPWLAAHWDAARKKTPLGYQSSLVTTVLYACDEDELARQLAFFTPRVKELEGAARPLAENADRARMCIALRKHGTAAVTKFFKR